MRARVLLILYFLAVGPVFAQGNSPQIIRVRLDVSGTDEIVNRLPHCLKAELEKFDDIKIVYDRADWELSIVGNRGPFRAGYQDYGLSLVVLKNGQMQGHELFLGYPNLQGGCKDIASNFLERYLQKKIPLGRLK